MEDWSRSEILNLIGLPFILLGAAAAIFQVPYTAIRRTMLVLFLVAVVADTYFFVWWSSRQKPQIVRRRPSPKPSPSAKPSPTPSLPEKRSSPQPDPSKEQDRTEPSDEIAFNSSTFDDGVTRYGYCLDSAFEGRLHLDSKTIDVVLDRAKFELCTDSDDAKREVQFKVGIGRREDVAKGKDNLIIWGPHITKTITAGKDNALDFAPGRLLSINKNQLSKKGPLDLSKYKIVIRVFNPDKRGIYFHSYNLN